MELADDTFARRGPARERLRNDEVSMKMPAGFRLFVGSRGSYRRALEPLQAIDVGGGSGKISA
jgi:hypothetical protein